jgi:hypothetical protein
MSSKLPAAKQFRRWVTSEVLPSIRKTGTYEIPNAPNYSNEKLKELGNTSCVYIIHVKDNLYKFGMTANSYNRMQSHKNNLNYNEIIKIFEIPNSDISKTIEDRIKKYTNNAKIRKILDEGVEFFETNEEYNIESVLKDINIMVETEVEIYEKKSNNSKLDALSFIEIQKIKQYELMCKSDEIKLKQLEIEANMRIEIEREKTKQLQLQLDLAILNQKQPLKGIVINNQLEDKPKIEIIKKDPIEKKIIARIDTRSKSKKCNDCDTMIYHTSSRCDPCEKVRRKENNQKNTNHPSKENLLKDLNELKYYTLVGQKYNVSDNTIRKWLKK